MTISYDEIAKNAEAEAFITLLDGGTCELRTGSKPANTGAAATGTLAATLAIPATALNASASGGIAELAPIAEVLVVSAGTIGWARFKKGDGAVVFDGTVSLSGDGGDIISTLLEVLVGDGVTISSFSYERT